MLRVALVVLLLGCSSTSTSEPGSALDGGTTATPDAAITGTRVTLDFDELAGGVKVADQYAQHVTFSTNGTAMYVLVGAQGYGSSPPNFICPTYQCAHDMYLAFARPVSQLVFNAIGVNNSGPVASMRIFVADALAATVPIMGQGNDTIPVRVEISQANVSRLEIVNITDSSGLGMDDLTFVAR
jgi:hypothetical protein